MSVGRSAGALMLIGCLLAGLSVVVALTGGAAGLGSASIGGILVDGYLLCIGLGLVGVAAAAVPIVHHAATRAGFGIAGIGLVVIAIGSIVSLTAADPLASPAIVLMLLGLLLAVAGIVIGGLSMIRDRGVDRLIGFAMLVGVVLPPIAIALGPANLPGTAVLYSAGALLILGGLMAIGVIAVRSEDAVEAS